MSFQALAQLSKKLLDPANKSGDTFRTKELDVQTHYFTVNPKEIKDGIRLTLKLEKDFEVLEALTDSALDGIVAQYIKDLLSEPGMATATKGQSGPDYMVKAGKNLNPYKIVTKAIHDANKKAIVAINNATNLTARTASGTLIHFDHRRTVSDIHIMKLVTDTLKAGGKSFNILPRDFLTVIKGKEVIRQEHYDILMDISSYYTPNQDKVFNITLGLQGDLRSGTDNTNEGNTVVRTRRANLFKDLGSRFKTRAGKRIDWGDQQASDSKKQQIRKSLIAAMKKEFSGKKNVKLTIEKSSRLDMSSSKFRSKTRITEEIKTVTWVGKASRQEKTSTKQQKPQAERSSYISMIALFNAKLPQIVAGNMIGGRLHNQTGKFAESVKVTNIVDTAQGYPSVEYTYSRSPYDVFDPALGASPWNTPERDPKKLIEVSIRDIAVDLAISRFYTRRA